MSFNKFKIFLPRILKIAVLVASFAVMLGWIVGNPFLVRGGPLGLAPMSFDTALLLFVLSLGLIFKNAWNRWFSRLCSYLVLLSAGLNLFDDALAMSSLLDRFFDGLLADEALSVLTSTSSSLCFITLSLVNLYRGRTYAHFAAVIGSSIVISLGTVVILSFLLDFNTKYSSGELPRMSLLASICFILLAIAYLLVAYRDIRKKEKSRAAFFPYYVLVCGILLTVWIWQLLLFRDVDRNQRLTRLEIGHLKSNLDNTFFPLAQAFKAMSKRLAGGLYRNKELWSWDVEEYAITFSGLKTVTWHDRRTNQSWFYSMGTSQMDRAVEQAVLTKAQNVHQPQFTEILREASGDTIGLIYPVYKNEILIGYLSAEFSLRPFLFHLLHTPGFDVDLLENDKPFLTHEFKRTGKSSVNEWTQTSVYQFLNLRWKITMTPRAMMIRENASIMPTVVLTFGLSVSSLLFLALIFFQKSNLSERRLTRVLKWQEASINSIPLMFISVDQNGIVRAFNTEAENLLGYRQEDLIRQQASPVIWHDPIELAERAKELSAELGRKVKPGFDCLAAMSESRHASASEWTLIAKDGQKFNAVLSINAIYDDKGSLTGYIGVLEDITQKKERERMLKEQEARMLTSSRLASLGEMAGGIAHEINNPLTIIKGHVGVLKKTLNHKKEIPPEEIIKRVDLIDSTVDRIAKIIKGLRTYSRDSNHDDMEVVELNQIVDDTLSFCIDKFRHAQVQLQTDIEPDLQLKARPYQISQVLLNLLNNAYDAVSASSEKNVTISAHRDGSFIKVSVEDSGGGIPTHLREKIMEPFFTTKEVGRGVGLGLSISQGIIQSHGGKFFLDPSTPQTRFVICLPSI